jgi:hypothetical protein
VVDNGNVNFARLQGAAANRNNSQRDTDGDGYGNWCDADLNNDLKVNFADLALFRCQFCHQRMPMRTWTAMAT